MGAVAAAVLLASSGAQARELKGMSVPDRATVNGKTLQLNGAAVQKKFIFDVYAVAMWLERPTQSAREAVTSEQVKRIQLHMLRSASRRQVADALRAGFEKVNPNAAQLKDRLERLLGAIPDLKEGDLFTITYVPGEGTTLQSQGGKSLTLPGKDFGEGMFNIWLGTDPGTARIKSELLKGN